MAKYNLTQKQRDLLVKLVEAIRSGECSEPFYLLQSSLGCEIMRLEGRFDYSVVNDLTVLGEQGLLNIIYDKRGDMNFTIKQSGYDAVENDFEISRLPIAQQLNIGNYVEEMSGGNLQGIGLSIQSEVKQIINDPELLKKKVDELANQLFDVIKVEIPSEQLFAYKKNIEELKEQLVAKKQSASVLQKLFTTLAFLGDVEGTISLASRAWPLLYPLLVIASEKMTSLLH